MGEKGKSMSGAAPPVAEAMVDGFAALGDVSSKKMFGGFGIFADGVMFALVDPGGGAFVKIPPGEEERFAERHGRMPYGLVPEAVLSDPVELESWGRISLAAARAAKR